MTTSEIITVGDELINGSKVNTNAAWIADTLTKAGAEVMRITTVGDVPSVIAVEIERAVGEGIDFLILTGGLGPTPDDRTLDALSQALGVERKLDGKALDLIEESYQEFAEKGLVKEEGITPARKKMAILPVGSEPVTNPVGGAPAVLAEKGNTKILCLPGVPNEMKVILKENLENLGLDWNDEERYSLNLDVVGSEESALAEAYDDLHDMFPDIELRSYPECESEAIKVAVKISGGDKNYLSEVEDAFRELIKALPDAKVKNSSIKDQ